MSSHGDEGHSVHPSVRRWLPLISVEAGLATVFITFTGGAFLTGLALMLGANDFEIGLLGAVPFLAQLAQPLSAYLVDLTGARKAITVVASAIARQCWWLVLPLVLVTASWRLEAFILLVVVSNVTIMIATPSWMAWMADLIPGKLRGRYFGTRSAVVALTTVLATIGGGMILDHYRASDREPIGFAVISGIGCLFALVAVILLNRLPDRRPEEIRKPVDLSHFLAPLRSRSFRLLLNVSLGWNFAIGIAAPFFAAHMLTNLKMSFTLVSLYTALSSVMAISFNRPWGVVIDRFGCKPVMVVCAFGIAGVPLFWLFFRPDWLWLLIPEAIYSGLLWAGFNLAVFNIPMANSPRDGRTIYLAMFSVVTGIGYFVSSVLGGILAQQWSGIHWQVGPQTIVNYHILFALSSLLRLLAAAFFTTFHEPQEKRIPIMIQFMGYSVLKWLSVGRQIFPRSLK